MDRNEVTAEQFARRLAASGISSGQLEQILLVTQSTVSRLMRARIMDVRRHVAAFDRHEAAEVDTTDLDEVFADLTAAARRDPAVARLLTELRDVMRNA